MTAEVGGGRSGKKSEVRRSGGGETGRGIDDEAVTEIGGGGCGL